jgi:hypothetical protein
MSEIVLCQLKIRISAHWNQFTQKRWFFAISMNTGGSKYFPRKCGGFLELTRAVDMENYLDSLRTMAKAAVDRSGGQLLVFAGKLFVTEELMLHIVKRYFLSSSACS